MGDGGGWGAVVGQWGVKCRWGSPICVPGAVWKPRGASLTALHIRFTAFYSVLQRLWISGAPEVLVATPLNNSRFQFAKNQAGKPYGPAPAVILVLLFGILHFVK